MMNPSVTLDYLISNGSGNTLCYFEEKYVYPLILEAMMRGYQLRNMRYRDEEVGMGCGITHDNNYVPYPIQLKLGDGASGFEDGYGNGEGEGDGNGPGWDGFLNQLENYGGGIAESLCLDVDPILFSNPTLFIS